MDIIDRCVDATMSSGIDNFASILSVFIEKILIIYTQSDH